MNGTIFQGMKLIGGKLPPTSVVREEPKKMPSAPSAIEAVETKKKGRPSMKEKKKELRKAQMSALDMFIESKPSKAKVRDYFEDRIKKLKEDD